MTESTDVKEAQLLLESIEKERKEKDNAMKAMMRTFQGSSLPQEPLRRMSSMRSEKSSNKSSMAATAFENKLELIVERNDEKQLQFIGYK